MAQNTCLPRDIDLIMIHNAYLPPKKKCVLRPEMTVREILERWPHTRLNIQTGRWDVDPIKDANLTLQEFASRLPDGYRFDFIQTWLNNCAVLFDLTGMEELDGDPAMLSYERFHNLPVSETPEASQSPIAIHASEDGSGLTCEGGLPNGRWVLSDGLNAVRIQQDGPTVELLSAFQRTAGMSAERLFDGGFLDARVDGGRHEFDQVKLTSFSYENRSKSDIQARSSILLVQDRIWLEVSRPGKPVAWVLDDARLRQWQYHGPRQAIRHGWDAANHCLLFEIIDTRPDRRFERPKEFEGFSDEDIRDYVGTEWQELTVARSAKVISCWVAVGPEQLILANGLPGYHYSTTPVAHPPEPKTQEYEFWARTDPAQEGTQHIFSARDTLSMCIAIGSTRQGALAELEAAREGSGLPRERQERRYQAVVERRPQIEIEGYPLLSEAAAMIPLFMESLKTGFTLMRSRPHDGAITGGWDQLMIASPMTRMGDDEMVPRYIEHWLHQYQLDGQIFHVSDYDLSPFMLFHRWDLDDFMYLIISATWITHKKDRAMLDRIAGHCTHMLRVMLRDADGETGFIASRGIFPDWPPLDTGRKGITYPAMETGLWYEALRWWESLVEDLGESALAEKIRSTAKKIQSHYLPLFYDPLTGGLCDAVFPANHAPLRTYTVHALTPFQGCFGHELLEGVEPNIARHLLDYNIDLSFPGIRLVATDSAYPSAYEHIHWPLFDHLVAKAMRRGQSAEGMEAVLQVIERQYRWFRCAREMVQMWRDMTQAQLSRAAFWFGWSATGWYEAILSGAAGIWEEPGGLVYIPMDMERNVRVSNLPYRSGVWEIVISGKGRWVDQFIVDGEAISGVCKVPKNHLTPKAHTLMIVRRQTPPATPYVLESVGLILEQSELRSDGLHLLLSGPGRAQIRFFCDHVPNVFDNHIPISVDWDRETGIAGMEISRGSQSKELWIY